MRISIYLGGVKFKGKYFSDSLHSKKSISILIGHTDLNFPITKSMIEGAADKALVHSVMRCRLLPNHVLKFEPQ
jgi:hypothetical protein